MSKVPSMVSSMWLMLRLLDLNTVIAAVVQSLSCVQLFVTPWTAACQASLSFTICRSLLKLMSIESVMPSSHLILCGPLLLLPSIFHSIRVFSNELALCIRWPKYWSFSFNISPSSEYSGLINMLIFQNINQNVLMFILHVHKWHVNFRPETTTFSVASSKWNVPFLLHFSSRSCIIAPEF